MSHDKKIKYKEAEQQFRHTELTVEQSKKQNHLLCKINILANLVRATKLQFCVALHELFVWIDDTYGPGMRKHYFHFMYLDKKINLKFATAQEYARYGKNEKIILERSKEDDDYQDSFKYFRELLKSNGVNEVELSNKTIAFLESIKKDNKKDNKNNENKVDDNNKDGDNKNNDDDTTTDNNNNNNNNPNNTENIENNDNKDQIIESLKKRVKR